MNQNYELVFLIDKSRSMFSEINNIAECFNTTIMSERFSKNNTLVSVVLFSETKQLACDRRPISKVGSLNIEKINFEKGTALLDTLGYEINKFEIIHKYTSQEINYRTLFVIISDGIDDSSYRYTVEEINQMIMDKKKIGWQFIFIGTANTQLKNNGSSNYIRKNNIIKNKINFGSIFDYISNFIFESEEENDE